MPKRNDLTVREGDTLTPGGFVRTLAQKPIISVFLGGDGREKDTVLLLGLVSREVRGVRSPFVYEASKNGMRDHIEVADLTAAFAVDPGTSVLVIGPVQGVKDDGSFVQRTGESDKAVILKPRDLDVLPQGSLFLAGRLPGWAKEHMTDRGIAFEEILSRDDFAFYNAVPTAEGAVYLAIGNTDFTLFGSNVAVLGFGRTGIVMARTLQGLGARVTVVARNPGARSGAWALGYATMDFGAFTTNPSRFDVIFNTVPALVITAEVIDRLRKDCLIIDLASSPGGTDFEAAAKRGLKALLAPGLPAKFAPKTASKILAMVIADAVAKNWPHLAPDLDRIGGELL
ncbi:MAG TPA: hypothetical protein GX507_01340 [Clostridia bacterium]|nr:hypothetical protein [Clostridia bacterium]